MNKRVLTLFPKTDWAPLGYSDNFPKISHPKVCFLPGFEDMPNFLTPTPSRGRTSPHQNQKFVFVLLFLIRVAILTSLFAD